MTDEKEAIQANNGANDMDRIDQEYRSSYPSRKRSNLEKQLKDVDKRIEEGNKSLFASTFSAFYPAYYDEVEIPPEAIQVDEYGSDYIVPRVIKPWVCRYYYQPEKKARLMRHSALAMGLSLIHI